MQTFNNYHEIIEALKSGKSVYWQSLMYDVSVKPNGDLICKCGSSISILTNEDKLINCRSFTEFFTPLNSL
jgi:hypothetical protein